MATQKLSNEVTMTSILKKQATLLNKEMLQASNELVDGSVATAEKWQNLTEKMLKTGLKMLAKQQDLLLTTIEATKGQFDASTKRFNKLVGVQPKKVKAKVKEVLDTDVTIDSIMEAAIAPVKKVVATPVKKIVAAPVKKATTPPVKKTVTVEVEKVVTVPVIKATAPKKKVEVVAAVEVEQVEIATA